MGGHFQWINGDGGGRRDDDDNKKEVEDEDTDDECERMIGLYLSCTFFPSCMKEILLKIQEKSTSNLHLSSTRDDDDNKKEYEDEDTDDDYENDGAVSLYKPLYPQ